MIHAKSAFGYKVIYFVGAVCVCVICEPHVTCDIKIIRHGIGSGQVTTVHVQTYSDRLYLSELHLGFLAVYT